MEVTEKRLEAQHAVVIRKKAPAGELGPAMSEGLTALGMFVATSATAPAGPPFARYLSMEGEEWEFECGMTVLEPMAGAGPIESCELPAGDAVSTLHIGSYETLGETWTALQTWVQEQGLVGAAPPWELYLTNPTEQPDPTQWRTEIVIPVTSAG